MTNRRQNSDDLVVQGFGEEWGRFTQRDLVDADRRSMFEDFFSIFPWSSISSASIGADFGCGSGRWAMLVAPRVGHLYLIDAAEAALAIARENLKGFPNVSFQHASVEAAALADYSLDFAYSLGVLHHVPDTTAALKSVTRKLRSGAPLLIYLYYAFDNRPLWFRMLWRLSDFARQLVSRSPRWLRFLVCDSIAVLVYWPLARSAKLLDRLGITSDAWPLSWYKDRSLYVMRTDALDRFGTRLEKRFTRAQIEAMLLEAGLSDILFSNRAPFWCALGRKR